MFSYDPTIDRSPFCDRALTVTKAWETTGTGSFISEPLAADMLRAVAYRYAGWSFQKRTKGVDLLSCTFITRSKKRILLNGDAILAELENHLNKKVCIRKVLDRQIKISNVKLETLDGKEQILLFASTDIVVGSHGAGLTNIIFMLPNSLLSELFPPFWKYACYERLANNVGLIYMRERAVGKMGPQCEKDQTSLSCQYEGIRDQNFEVNPEIIVKRLEGMIPVVWRKKYGFLVCFPFSYLCFVPFFFLL